MKPRNLTEFVLLCENVLGCPLPDNGKPDWKNRQAEVGKIKARARKDRRLTLDNLLLALTYCQRQQIQIKSPVGVTYHVDAALELAAIEERNNIDNRIAEAVAHERALDDLFSAWWISRLQNSQGGGRHEVYSEWQAQRQGETARSFR